MLKWLLGNASSSINAEAEQLLSKAFRYMEAKASPVERSMVINKSSWWVYQTIEDEWGWRLGDNPLAISSYANPNKLVDHRQGALAMARTIAKLEKDLTKEVGGLCLDHVNYWLVQAAFLILGQPYADGRERLWAKLESFWGPYDVNTVNRFPAA